jgi:hypothetical protein
MDWNETPSPFARLCLLYEELREEQELGTSAWCTRLPEFFPLIAQITDPAEQEQVRALTADWISSIVNEESALDAQALLLDAAAQHRRVTEGDTSHG